MNVKQDYIAITIGPIMDTMSIVTKPGALWLSSYMFSYISKSLCIKIGEIVGTKSIISPYICTREENEELYNELLERKDGVGLFHDHIIFRESKGIWSELQGLIVEVVNMLAEKLGVKKEQLRQYLMIKACRFSLPDGENPILYCGKMLDSLELPKVFSAEETVHPLKQALGNKEAKVIAKGFVNTVKSADGAEERLDENAWGLVHTIEQETKDGRTIRVQAFKNIPAIAYRKGNERYKKNNYYCLLRADGDNVSKIIARLDGDGECRDFSCACLKYCSDVAAKVKDYGGVTIYAGGDDLFAMVPCEGEDGSVFSLMCQIDGLFKENFSTYIESIEKANEGMKPEDRIPVPSLSFGALICHSKYPLYEAVARSAELLYGVAKRKNNEKKNCVAVQLQKHSGQSETLLIQKASLGAFEGLLRGVLDDEKNAERGKESTDAFLLSAAHKLIMYKGLFDSIKESVENSIREDTTPSVNFDIYQVFGNLFDASYHVDDKERKEFLHKTLPEFYEAHCLSDGILLLEDGAESKESAKVLGQVLRMLKFFIEEGAE